VLGCGALNDGLIRRVGWLRACFGLAPMRRVSEPLQAQLPRQGQ
jgi:glucans biosynthesis protein C